MFNLKTLAGAVSSFAEGHDPRIANDRLQRLEISQSGPSLNGCQRNSMSPQPKEYVPLSIRESLHRVIFFSRVSNENEPQSPKVQSDLLR